MAFKLTDLLASIDYDVICGNLDISVNAVTTNSRKVTNGDLFVAVIGVNNDGHKYVKSAIDNGASCVVIDKNNTLITNEEIIDYVGDKVTVISCDDNSIASAEIYAKYLGEPEKSIEFIGVTGTKGKTTATFMIYEILKRSGINSGLLGTVCNYVNGQKKTTTNTTLPMTDLYDTILELKEGNTKACVMEVSSHGLKQRRVHGIEYKVACFTNFFEDHIGPNDHPDMEDYFNSKMMIFDKSEFAIVNSDCNEAKRVFDSAKKSGCTVYTYGFTAESDVYATDIRRAYVTDTAGSRFMLKSPWYEGEVSVSMQGEFNIYNALLAISVAGVLGVDFSTVKDALANTKVPGRVQPVINNLGISCLVDYAHNEASLQSVLEAMRPYVDGRIISVFGCGGDRSHERRFGMGRVAGKYSDYTVITSDNPRTEDPDFIISQIVIGISETDGEYEIEANREIAIEKAIKMAKPGDLVLIAGKGHEDYQEINGVKTHFDDYEVASKVIAQLEVAL